MEIKGLLFKRINQEFELFKKGTGKDKSTDISDEENRQIIEEYEEVILSDSLKTLHDRYPKFYEAVIRNHQTISKKMEESFSYYFGYLNGAHEVYESIRRYLNENKVADKNKLLLPYYGSLIRLADQIGTMLLNGYPDGALRLFRSFYEYVAVLLLFIKEQDRKGLQEKFIDHYHREKRKNADSFQKNYKELKFAPLDEKYLNQLEDAGKAYADLYGKAFLEGEYGWANDIFNLPKRVTFRDIENHVGITRFRPFYVWASGYSHSGFESMIPFFDEKNQEVILHKIIRQTTRKKSFIDPMQLTIALFHEVNSEFLKIYSVKSEYEINFLMFRRIFVAMLKSFDNLNPDEDGD